MITQTRSGQAGPTTPADADQIRDGVYDGVGLLPNGSGAAAILAAAIGSLALGVFSFAGDAWPAARRALIIWNPSGPLSGERQLGARQPGFVRAAGDRAAADLSALRGPAARPMNPAFRVMAGDGKWRWTNVFAFWSSTFIHGNVQES
jgi:hypothetical protein